MKKYGSLIVWVLILSLFLLSLTFVDFLALADIHQDYVSSKVLESEKIDVAKKLPEWTSATLEWTYISISLLLKAVIIVIILITLIRIIKRLKL